MCLMLTFLHVSASERANLAGLTSNGPIGTSTTLSAVSATTDDVTGMLVALGQRSPRSAIGVRNEITWLNVLHPDTVRPLNFHRSH